MNHFKTEIQCSQCGEHWMVGDRERTNDEKRHWVCPKCQELNGIRSDENKVDELESERAEKEEMSPKDRSDFYIE